jgi:hypothetical protein
MSSLDNIENQLIDSLPTYTQFKLGRVAPEEIRIKPERWSLEEHLRRIRLDVTRPEVKVSNPKPCQQLPKVDKKKVRAVV